MTTKEEKSLEALHETLRKINAENQAFRESVTKQVEAINSKVNTKEMPVYYEQDILKTAQTAIQDSIKSVLTGYNSPLSKLVMSVVDENSAKLRKIISDSFSEVIELESFKASVVAAFSHKVSRSIISNNDGLFDKVANELKQDSVFKSKMALAVSAVVEECLLQRRDS